VASQLPKHLCRRRRPNPPKWSRGDIFTNYITVDGPGTPYKFSFVKELNPNPANRPGMEFKSSLSWFCEKPSIRRFRAIPFVSLSGKFSLHTLYVWKSYPEQVIFSLISTVFARILKILRKRRVASRRILNCAFKASVVYVITRSDILDRFLGMSRKAPVRKVENFVCKCVYELDENKRFVYSQAFYQANWLKSQVFRPRDKSRKELDVGTHLRNLGFLDMCRRFDDVKASQAFERSSDLWEVCRPSGKFTHTRYHGTLERVVSLSDLIVFSREPEECLSDVSDW